MPLISGWLRSRSFRGLCGLFLGAIAFTLLLRLGLSFLPVKSTPATSLVTLEQIPPTAQPVRVGFYGLNIYNLDIASNSYFLDAYIWFRWKGKIDPIADLEFANAVDDWGMTQKPGYEKPQLQPDGSFYQILRVEGRFIQPFNLARYPLDQQQISIMLENSIYTAKDLVYLADTQDSGYADTLAIHGWSITDWSSQNLLRTYSSNFGLAIPDTSPYSVVRFAILIERPVSYFIWKLLFPLMIVLMSGCGALLLHPSYADSRVVLPVTALLTVVFLQQSYSNDIPEVGYLVLLDKIYALAYFLIITAVMAAIFTAGRVKDKGGDSYVSIVQIDRCFLALQVIALVTGVWGLIQL